MNHSARILIVCALSVIGGIIGLVFLGGQVQSCLGPLGVTPVQCAKAHGTVPGVGLGQPVVAAIVAVATLVAWPGSPGRRAQEVLGGVVGGVVGGALFVAFRPLTMEGFDSNGEWISLVRPLDPSALATSIIIAALVGVVVMRLARRWAPTRES